MTGKLIVSSLQRAVVCASDIAATTVVSLVDPGTPLPVFGDHVVNHIIRRMNDTEVATDPFSPMMDDVVAVFDFVKHDDNVLVHCEGGISRSTAIAIGLLIRRGTSIVDA